MHLKGVIHKGIHPAKVSKLMVSKKIFWKGNDEEGGLSIKNIFGPIKGLSIMHLSLLAKWI